MTVDAHPYAYLIETDWTYWFGPADAPLLTLNAADPDDGTLWACEEPAGWSATDASTPLDARQYGDGAYAGETTFAARTLSFGPGLTVAPDRRTAAAAMRRLRSIAQSRDPVLYTQTDYPPQSLWLRATGRPNLRWVHDTAFEWSFVMVADDPMRFDAAQAAIPLVTQLPGASIGLTYPLVYPLGYALGSPSGRITATNDGDEAAQAIYTLTGPVTNPTVYSRRTGLSFTVHRTVAANEVVVANTATGQVLLNGVSILGDVTGDLPPIVPGDNLIQWGGSSPADVLGPDNQHATLTVNTASTWK